MKVTQTQLDDGGCVACQGPVGTGAADASVPADGVPGLIIVDVDQSTWVGIQLRSASGRWMAGTTARVTTSDGSTIDGTLDELGRMRIEGIAPGPCEVRFTGTDARWRVVKDEPGAAGMVAASERLSPDEVETGRTVSVDRFHSFELPDTDAMEVVVVEDGDGRPVAGVVVDIIMPDGTTVSATTSSTGLIRLEGFGPAPSRLGSTWDDETVRATFDVVATERSTLRSPADEPRTMEELGAVALATDRLARVEEHRVRSGESIASLARDAGMPWPTLARFNWGTDDPERINPALRDQVGCTRKTADGFNYRFDDRDDPGILFVPANWSASPRRGERLTIRVRRPVTTGSLEVETVTELGHRQGGVELVFAPEGGGPLVRATTDHRGYARVTRIRAGRYRVTSGDAPVYFRRRRSTATPATLDDLTPAVVDTANLNVAVTQLVVARTGSTAALQRVRLLSQAHHRSVEVARIDDRGSETRDDDGSTYPIAHRDYWADNLALAAGWDRDGELAIDRLITDVLPGWLDCYFPTARARGYHVVVFSPDRPMRLFASDGRAEGTFSIARPVTGRLGAYAVFEQVDANMFVDMANRHTGLRVGGGEEAGIRYPDLVEASDRPRILEALDRHATDLEVVLFVPSGGMLTWLAARGGGTGRLEDYPDDDEVRSGVHDRNLAVCRTTAAAYHRYLDGYCERVRATETEEQLRALGPPRSPVSFPAPAGVTDRELADLAFAQTTHELDAWIAIAEHLDGLHGRKSQGHPFVRIKPKFKVDPKSYNRVRDQIPDGLRRQIPMLPSALPAEVEIEGQLDFQWLDGGFRYVFKGDAAVKVKLQVDQVVNTMVQVPRHRVGPDLADLSGVDLIPVPVEASFKRSVFNPDKATVALKVADRVSIELDTLGKAKLAYAPTPGVWIETESNARSGEFGAGVTLRFKDLVEALYERNPTWRRGQDPGTDPPAYLAWLERLAMVELQIMVGFVGTREETILAVVSGAPGFFQRRSVETLFAPSMSWADLSADERASLSALGWGAESWSLRYLDASVVPASARKGVGDLTAEEKIAIVHLGFYSYHDYATAFARSARRFADYDF